MKRLERSRTDRVLLGVCGGLGEYFSIDGDVVRVVWVLSIVAGGIGLVPYVAAYLLLPESTGDEAPPVQDRMAKNLGLLLVGLGGAVLFHQMGIGFEDALRFWHWRFLVPLALLTMGAFLVWPRTRNAVGLSKERKLHRSVSNRVLAGVAGGIAEDVEVDPNLVRLAFVLAAVLTSGFALLVYLLLVVVLPETDASASTAAGSGPPPPSEPPPPAPLAPTGDRAGSTSGTGAPGSTGATGATDQGSIEEGRS